MKVYEVELTTIVVVAAADGDAAERWAALNSAEIGRMQTLEATGCREIKTLAELGRVDNGQWLPDATPYGLEKGDKRTLDDLLPADTESPYRCDKTVDMFTPCPNPVTAGIDRDTTGAIGQP